MGLQSKLAEKTPEQRQSERRQLANAGIGEFAKRLCAFHLHRPAIILKAFRESIVCLRQSPPRRRLQVEVVEAPVIAIHAPGIVVFLDTHSNPKPWLTTKQLKEL